MRKRITTLLNNHLHPDKFTAENDAKDATEITKALNSFLGKELNEPISSDFSGHSLPLVFLDTEGNVHRHPRNIIIPDSQEELLKLLETIVSTKPASKEAAENVILNFFDFHKLVNQFEHYGEVADEFENLKEQARTGLIDDPSCQERLELLRTRIAVLLNTEVQTLSNAQKVSILNEDLTTFFKRGLLTPEIFAAVKKALLAKVRTISQ